jgi:hypothetical protein
MNCSSKVNFQKKWSLSNFKKQSEISGSVPLIQSLVIIKLFEVEWSLDFTTVYVHGFSGNKTQKALRD